MRVIQYSLSGIIICFAIGIYLDFLAQRDTKMMNYYDSTIESRVRE